MNFKRERDVRYWLRDHAQERIFWIEQGNIGGTVGFPDCLIVDWGRRLVPVELKYADSDVIEKGMGVIELLRPAQRMCNRQLSKCGVDSWVLVGSPAGLHLGRWSEGGAPQKIIDFRQFMTRISSVTPSDTQAHNRLPEKG